MQQSQQEDATGSLAIHTLPARVKARAVAALSLPYLNTMSCGGALGTTLQPRGPELSLTTQSPKHNIPTGPEND